MIPVRHAIYLHGFASSPGSSKAQRFAAELARRGVGFSCPDFNQPAFETLTVTRMLEQTAAAIEAARPGPVALVGSSLGAFVALHAAARDAAARTAGRSPAVDRLVLLAPALDFGGNRLKRLGEQGIDEWRSAGFLDVFHWALGAPRRIGFGLYQDAAQYDARTLPVERPTLVFQGRGDETVDPAGVAQWARAQPRVDLRLLDDDHQLSKSIDTIWRESARWFGLDPGP